jgi:hypothetical protein
MSRPPDARRKVSQLWRGNDESVEADRRVNPVMKNGKAEVIDTFEKMSRA